MSDPRLPMADPLRVPGPVPEGGQGDSEVPVFERVAVFGGVYSNHLALRALLAEVEGLAVDAVLCLGDLGAFGPHPDRTVELIRESGILVVRGNYDDSLARGLEDCQCGYTDPRDNHFAHISYDYTFRRTSPEHRAWMATLPDRLRFRIGDQRVLAFHGSPRRMNEFLWETTTPQHFLEGLAVEHQTDLLLGTHSGLHWSRTLAGGGGYVNVGALGRPANDGRPVVWYALLEAGESAVNHRFIPLSYDHEGLAREMEEEGLPGEFIETIRTGWWTTCLEVLPGKERSRGKW